MYTCTYLIQDKCEGSTRVKSWCGEVTEDFNVGVCARGPALIGSSSLWCAAGDLRDAKPGLPPPVPADTVLQVWLAEPHDARRVLLLAVRRSGAAALHALLRHTGRGQLFAVPPLLRPAGRRHADSRRPSGRFHRCCRPAADRGRDWIVSLVPSLRNGAEPDVLISR